MSVGLTPEVEGSEALVLTILSNDQPVFVAGGYEIGNENGHCGLPHSVGATPLVRMSFRT